MSDLFSSLHMATRALDAQRYGLDVAGQNIANVNTPGYARRVIDLAAVAPLTPGTAGGGVDVMAIRALRDRLLETRLHNELPAQRREAAMADALSMVEASIGEPGSSIDKALEDYFDSFARLSEAPVSAVAREEVLVQGDALATSFRSMAGRLDSARRDADRNVRDAAEQINTLVRQVTALNLSIGSSPSVEASLSVRDEQGELVRRLSELVDLQVLNRPEGGVDLAVGQGRLLVVGETSYPIDVQSAGPGGYATLQINGSAVTNEITGGRLGGLLHVRDVNIPDYQTRLDSLAFEVAGQVNGLHAAGFDQTGAAAGNFFEFSSPLTGTAGAAAALTVRAAVAADSRLIAAGADPLAQGDNEVAKSIAALRSAAVLDGGTSTLSDVWGKLVYRVGRDTKAAEDERDSRGDIVRQVDALRDEVSGVSLDEEAMHLLKFQRAYEANAQFFRTISETIDTLMQTVR